MARTILVTGATGKQGGAVVNALVKANKSSNEQKYTILALTRNKDSPAAQGLTNLPNVQLVVGDLDNPDAIFQQTGYVDGVFSVQTYNLQGQTVATEERQGKALADSASKHGVKQFVYSSVERGGKDWTTDIPHFASKANIEAYIKNTQLQWTFLRPVCFMENISPDFYGKIFGATWASWLGGNQRLQLVSVADIGSFALLAFEKPDEWSNKAIALAGDEKTLNEIDFIFMKQFGYGMPRGFGWMGSAFTAYDKDMAKMFTFFRDVGFRADIKECRRLVYDVKSTEQWLTNSKAWHPYI